MRAVGARQSRPRHGLARIDVNPWIGWSLAVAGTAIGYARFGWRGAALCVSAMVFWLLLQFSVTLRLLRAAGQAPVGSVASAVMLHSRLRKGMRLMQVIRLTRSLGRRVGEQPERWAWTDAGGDSVELRFESGRLADWTLERAAASDGA